MLEVTRGCRRTGWRKSSAAHFGRTHTHGAHHLHLLTPRGGTVQHLCTGAFSHPPCNAQCTLWLKSQEVEVWVEHYAVSHTHSSV